MAVKNIAMFGIIVVLFSSLAYAGCSYDSFKAACNNCTFDAYGKMDKACWEGYQASGTACLGKKYPLMSFKYGIGQCPQVDDCVTKLTSCKDAVDPGSNLLECKDFRTLNCFIMADDCVAAANEICANGKTEEEAGWDNVFTSAPLEDNTTKPPEPNTTQNETLYSDEQMSDTIENFLCPEFFILFGVLVLAYRMN